MTEEVSTAGVPLRWLADEAKTVEAAHTRFFLFPGEAGHVVVHERSDGDTENLSEVGVPTHSPRATIQGEMSSSPARPMRVPRTRTISRRPEHRYILLKKFEGFVTSRRDDGFSARLFESSNDYPVVNAEFDLEELSETDRKLAIEGAPMVWTIGYRYDGSTRKRESSIYLRRLPPWSDKEIQQGRKSADELISGIRWE